MFDNLFGNDQGAGVLEMYERAYPKLEEFQSQANADRRAADVADFQRLGGQYVNAVMDANPNQRALVDGLNAQARAELESAGRLSERERYDAAQAVRRASDARGRAYGNSAIYNEMLNDYRVRNEDEREARALAGQVIGINQSLVGDPFLAVTGRQSQVGQMVPGSLQQAGGFSQTGSGMFDPMNPYAADLYNTNFNAAAAANIAAANNQAGLIGGIIGGGARIGAAKMMSDRRVKTALRHRYDDKRGFGVWEYRYVWDPVWVRRLGVLAQEVQRVLPEAVREGTDGMLYVNYNLLGLQPREWQLKEGAV